MFFHLVAATAVASAGFILWAGQRLPGQVASRFDGDGAAAGWMSRDAFLVLMLLLCAAMPAVTALMQMRFSRQARTRIPHPEHWYAPQRLDATVSYLEMHAAVFAFGLTAFLDFVFWRIVAAHQAAPRAPVLDKPLFLLGLGVFVAFAGGWALLRRQHFSRPA